MPEIPYPPVFHDWQVHKRRVATSGDPMGVGVEITLGDPPGVYWQRVVLTEGDACLLAASLLERAGKEKLARRVLHKLGTEA